MKHEKLLGMIVLLNVELDDAVSFMETFEDNPDSFGSEGLERLERKRNLLNVFNGMEEAVSDLINECNRYKGEVQELIAQLEEIDPT